MALCGVNVSLTVTDIVLISAFLVMTYVPSGLFTLTTHRTAPHLSAARLKMCQNNVVTNNSAGRIQWSRLLTA